ncbi:cupin domain-containing protein [Butyrivibrio fibrisolvens]|uniref:polysaccharide biosynthesis C-terminal domain-containing protein n=1 Tax=Butyrivibrio fibrisolvens TaxID=831 RepID=UPI0003B2ED86|nr:cupin domain-containing protein [Butyrivibrio fibrisolvens]
MLIERLKPDFTHKDDRGTLTQLIRRGYSQINVITSKGGVFRGGHYHELNTEAFYIVSGRCRVTVRKDGKTQTEEFSTGDFFRVGPYVTHDFDYLEDSVLVTMYSLGVELDDGKMDSYVPEENKS